MTTQDTFIHYNRGVPKLRYSIRVDREIRQVYTKPVNRVLVDGRTGAEFLLTKGTCETASRLGRLRLLPYTGKWPVCALLWARLLEIVRR